MKFIELGKEALQMRAILFVLVLTTCINQSAFASPQKFKVGDDEFTIDVPKGWQVQRDFFFPVGLVSPDNKEDQRTVIGITPAGAADDQGVFENANKDLKPFIEGREEWLANNDGKSISYDPYEKMKWKGIEAAHVLGYRYELPSGKFYSRSFYILCNGARFIHFKTLVHEKLENEHNALFDRTIKSFQCTQKSVALNGSPR